MSDTKAFLVISILLTALMAAGGLYMLRDYHIFTKVKLEDIGGQALGVKVTVGNLSIDREYNTMTVNGIQIFNPPKKFSDGAALQIDTVDVTFAPSDPGTMHIREIRVDGIQNNLEVLPKTSNLLAIDRLVKSRHKRKEAESRNRVRIMVDSISLNSLRVRPRAVLDKRIGSAVVPAEPAAISSIGIASEATGSGVNGTTPAEVIALVWDAIYQRMSTTATRSGFYTGMTPATEAEQMDQNYDETPTGDVESPADVETPAMEH